MSRPTPSSTPSTTPHTDAGAPRPRHRATPRDGVEPAGQGPLSGPSGLRALARSSALMAAGTAVSRVLGFVKAAVLAVAIGVLGSEANIFDVANRIPNTVYLLIAGGVLNAVLVPQIVRAAKDPDGGKQFVDRLVTLALLGLAVVTAACTAAAPWLLRLYAGDQWEPAEYALGIAFGVWVLPQIFFYGLYTVLGQILNARGSFGPYMWAPVANNVVAIAGLVVFIVLFGPGQDGQHAVAGWTPGMVAVLAGSATLGVVVQALVLLVPLRRLGFTWTPRLGLRGVGLGSAGTVAMWTFAGILVSQLGFVVTTRVALLAAEAGPGVPGPAVYGYAYLLYVLPHSLVAVSVVTALFTRLSHHVADRDEAGARADVSLGLRMLGIVSVLAATGLIVLGVPAGVVIAGDDGAEIGPVVGAMAVGLPAMSALYLAQRAFYAREDARRPFLGVVVSAGTSLVLSVVCAVALPPEWVVAGLGLAQSLGNIAGLTTVLLLLRRRTGPVDGARVLRLHVRVVLGAVVAGLVGWGVREAVVALVGGISGHGTALAVLVPAGAAIVAVYLGALRVMHVEELGDVVGQLRRR